RAKIQNVQNPSRLYTARGGAGSLVLYIGGDGVGPGRRDKKYISKLARLTEFFHTFCATIGGAPALLPAANRSLQFATISWYKCGRRLFPDYRCSSNLHFPEGRNSSAYQESTQGGRAGGSGSAHASASIEPGRCLGRPDSGASGGRR